MKCKFVFILIIIVTLLSCAGKHEKKIIPSQPTPVAKVEKVKPPASFSDTMIISQTAAVFYYPDSLQDLRIKADTDSGVYKSTVHEMFYQMRYTKIILRKYYPRIKVMEARNVRYLLFQKKGGAAEWIDLNTKNDARGLIIFDAKQSPRLLDMTNIETELGFYFQNNKPN